MRTLTIVLSSVGFLALSQAWADEPPPAQSSTAASTATPTPVSAPSSPAATSASTEAPKAAELDARDRRVRALGYKPETGRDGKTIYCRREQQLGTHFDKKICDTAENLERIADQARDATEHAQKQRALPHTS